MLQMYAIEFHDDNTLYYFHGRLGLLLLRKEIDV